MPDKTSLTAKQEEGDNGIGTAKCGSGTARTVQWHSPNIAFTTSVRTRPELRVLVEVRVT